MKKITSLFAVFFFLVQFTFSQTQIGQDINGEAALDRSGYSVSMSSDGSIVAIGAYGNDVNGSASGHVRIYKNINEVWTQVGADIDGEAAGDHSGSSVSMSSDGSIVAIGAPYKDGNGTPLSGQVRIYKNINEVWTQVGSDINGAFFDKSGNSVSISSDGSIVAIGAIGNGGNGTDSGHVRIYKNINEVWTQVGSDINGEAAYDYSGGYVSMSSDGSSVAIGASGNDENGADSGHVRIYKNINEVWTQIGQDINGEAAGDFSGRVSMSSDGSIVAIGASRNAGNGTDSGHVRVYKNINDIWTQVGADIDGEAVEDRSGTSVSMSSDGNTVAIGADRNAGNGTDSGHVRIYKNINEVWTQIGTDIDGEAAEDNFGYSVSMSSDGTIVAIGAPINNGTGSGYVRVYNIPPPNTAPTAVCQSFTAQLGADGSVTIQASDLDGGSSDAEGPVTLSVSPDTFDCSHVGALQVVTLTVTDSEGLTDTCTAIVTVEDNTSPVLVCQDFTIEIGADGTATLDPSDVIASNDDACGILTVAVDITEFSCADIGTPVTVQVFSQDNNGNLATCTATVTAVDLLAPVVTCPADQTVDPGAGNLFYILPDYWAIGEVTAIDNCSFPLPITTQDPAQGTPLPDGIYTITFTATDEYGNVGTCEFELTVESRLGVGDNNAIGSVQMYPNPAKHTVTIGNPASLSLENLRIFDIRGRMVKTIDLRSMGTQKTIDVSEMAAATYLVIIQGKDGQTTKRLIKE